MAERTTASENVRAQRRAGGGGGDGSGVRRPTADMDFSSASGNDTQMHCELQHRNFVVPENGESLIVFFMANN